jgi:hypothetical protein
MSYLHSDVKGPNLDHPDSAIRLASVVHRFRVPKITFAVSFVQSFSTTGRSDKTRKLMRSADDARQRLTDAVTATKVSAERVIADATKYQPLIHSILLSCKVQPEQARLDERLMFVWKSGIEEKPAAFSSEAMMYDLVMVCVSEALGQAVWATEKSVQGEFVSAAQGYAAAAGIFDFLAEDHLPKWIAKGTSVDNDKLPAECHVPVAKALVLLFMANGQQMAVATVLMKEGEPNYSLLAKLCLGIKELLEEFVALLRREAFTQMSRLDPDFLTLVTLQINVQQALSLYFHARSLWKEGEYGLAIAMASEATVALRQRENTASDGVPDVNQTPSLKPLANDLKDLRGHMALLLRSWEKDNSSCYFTAVPQRVPAESKLKEGIQMKKKTGYKLQEAEPVLLALPESALQRSDSDLAREMQRRLNAGEE